MTSDREITLEFFGASTFRLRAYGHTIFLDTWLHRPSNLPVHIRLEDVTECDAIVISHAHFDRTSSSSSFYCAGNIDFDHAQICAPGADVIAKRTGATIYANGEAINVMRQAEVPEHQLIPVQGGERFKLGHSGILLKIYPALHCLVTGHDDPNTLPEVADSGQVQLGDFDACTADITKLMTRGFGWMRKGPAEVFDGNKALIAMHHYLADPANKYSFFDGGQLAYHFVFPPKEGDTRPRSLLFSSHAGGWEGIIRAITPKPDYAILGCVGRANLDGVAFQGSIAEFLTRKVEWLGQPKYISFALGDCAPLKPFTTNTECAASSSFIENMAIFTMRQSRKTDGRG